jgi:hypothetical protein
MRLKDWNKEKIKKLADLIVYLSVNERRKKHADLTSDDVAFILEFILDLIGEIKHTGFGIMIYATDKGEKYFREAVMRKAEKVFYGDNSR